MKNRFLTIVFVFLSTCIFAQNATLSPYSYYGLGAPASNRTVENNAMGGITAYADSTHFSLDNPATLGKLKFVQYRIGVGYTTANQLSGSNNGNSTTTSLNYLALSVPTKYFAFSFGLRPESSVGYRFSSKETLNGQEQTSLFDGSGGVNSTFLSLAVNPIKGLSFGISASYAFGLTEKTFRRGLVGVQLDTRVFTRSELSGMRYTFAMHYNQKVFDRYNIHLAAMHRPKASLESANSRTVSTITTSGTIGTQQSIDLRALANTSNTFAAENMLGIAFGVPQQLFFGATYVAESSGRVIPLETNSDAQFVASSQLSVGGFFIPKHDSFTNYLKRISYRVGARWEHTGLELKNQAIKDFGINFGLGLPVGGLSKINIGLELGQLGTSNQGLIKENYTNISVGFSLSDVWFIKRKYD